MHILFVMAWMACVFVLPRVILHWQNARSADRDTEALQQLSIRLFRFGCIMALLALGFGAWLWLGFGFGGTWLQLKLLFVLLLIGYYLVSAWLLWQALKFDKFYGGIGLRIYNESSLLLVIPIIYLVVAKPV